MNEEELVTFSARREILHLNKFQLENEKEQTLKWWSHTLRQNVQRVKTRFDKIDSFLQNHTMSSAMQCREISEVFRKIHDVWGYKAKDDLISGGLCSGAIYRSSSFIKTDQTLRSGRKFPMTGQISVHIEHTTPVKALAIELVGAKQVGGFSEDERVRKYYQWLLNSTIATAMLRGQDKVFIKKRMSSTTHVFDVSHEDYGFPFRRYHLQQEPIYNVLTGAEVDIQNFHFQEHRKNMDVLFKTCVGFNVSDYIQRI